MKIKKVQPYCICAIINQDKSIKPGKGTRGLTVYTAVVVGALANIETNKFIHPGDNFIIPEDLLIQQMLNIDDVYHYFFKKSDILAIVD